ncbi:hypothetical protein L3Q82_001594 [Scortum barcoo]|uniref:Uncharacterized protein n=1 Tax=Scortum barcoo TaxID=214431 RepID=A0ACB8WB22_9TELE|nr:hypothetical protein L3Q82_001594 [Scortum barcoo]
MNVCQVNPGAVMQVGSSVLTQPTYQSAAHSHLSGGAWLQEEEGTNQRSAYCKELLMRGGTEFSFEELRAERFNQQKQQQLDERLKHLTELKEQLSVELEEKKRLLLLRTGQEVFPGSAHIRDSGPVSFQIYNESPPAAARPAGNELPDDVFLRPDERGLCLKIQYPRPGESDPGPGESDPGPGVVTASELSQQTEDLIQAGLQNKSVSLAPADPQVGTTEDLQTPPESCAPTDVQKPASKTRKKLSPIQETSVEASSLTSLGELSAGHFSPLQEDQEDQDLDQDLHVPSAARADVDPQDPDVRQQLLDLCDVTSSPDFHSESRHLPAVEEHSCLQLGGEVYHIYSRVLAGGFCVFKGATEDDYVLVKVDSQSAPWDFHQCQRLRKSLSSPHSLPLISCFLFLDGCITIYTTPPDHMFTELVECVPSEASVGHKAIGLLQLVFELQSCRLLHAGLQPEVLACCHRGFLSPGCVFPVDWSSSVDLELQQDVGSVQQVPSAQSYMGRSEKVKPKHQEGNRSRCQSSNKLV